MDNTKTSAFSNGLIWFGAAVSIAEILTGTLVAPLGLVKGLTAIIIGHLIGCIVFYFAGLIGAKTEKSSMETVKISFGQKGSLLFSVLNVLQLVGWTAVMIVSAATAASSIFNLGGDWVWSIIIALLIIVWVIVDIKNLNKLNYFAMGALFILTVILSTIVFKVNNVAGITEKISFGAAVELSVAMPLSWLPLISDYTRFAKKPFAATFTSTVVYFFTSCWMYAIGLGAALYTGQTDVSKIMMTAGFGLAGIAIIIFSTVTTTFLDVYSAGVSSHSISAKLKEKPTAIAVCVIGTILAIFTPITKYEDFLYLIGSVFAPMVAILICDYFIFKSDHSNKNINIINLIIWAAGFAVYRIFMHIDTPVGNTLPVMIITAVICILVNKFIGGKKNA